MINITFPDGSVRQYESGVTGYDVAMSISTRLAADVLAVSIKRPGEGETSRGTTIDVTRPITEDVQIRLLKWEDEEGKKVFWHSSSHLMAEALEALFPGVKFGIGPAIDNGFYYDVDMNGRTLTDADFKAI
jgi:threonyl-tRNA synthetase